MNCVGIIPARYESSRFPGKPLVEILGKPMIWWVYNKAIQCDKLDEIYVATDSEQIFNYCKKHHLNVIMTGPNPTGTDRIAEANEIIKADYVVNIQGDEPTINPNVIAMAIQPSFDVTNLMTKASVENMNDDIPKVVTNKNNFLQYMSRYPIPKIKGQSFDHMKQVCVYGFSANILKQFKELNREKLERSEDIEILRFIEHDIPVKMIEIQDHGSAVDYPNDIKKVEKELLSKYEAIIFDFDGVLVESEQIKSESFKKLFPEKFRPLITLEEGGKSRYEKIAYFYKKFLHKQLNQEQIQTLADKYQEMVLQPIINAPLIKETNQLLDYEYVDFYIVSGTPIEELKEILEKKGMIDKFKEIYGGEFEKEEIIKQISKKYHNGRVLYIGDQKSDKHASLKAGVNFFGFGPKFGNPEIQEVWL